jgi:hypothetical protein
VSDQLHDLAALSPGKEPLVPIWWTPAPVWTTWRRENTLPYWDSKSDPVAIPTTLRIYDFWSLSCHKWRPRAVIQIAMKTNNKSRRHASRWMMIVTDGHMVVICAASVLIGMHLWLQKYWTEKFKCRTADLYVATRTNIAYVHHNCGDYYDAILFSSPTVHVFYITVARVVYSCDFRDQWAYADLRIFLFPSPVTVWCL